MRPEGSWIIPTLPSRPHHHPDELTEELVDTIIAYKKRYRRCSEVIYNHLKNDGVVVSLSSVRRKLDDAGLVDTIHLMVSEKKRIYVYTLIDVYSRWCFAWATDRISTRQSIKFLKMAQGVAEFKFNCIQSDHGPEFSQHFSEQIKIAHRHSRVRKPNDNAYLERFNRTLQEECLNELRTNVKIFNQQLPIYLKYFNNDRLHMGINFSTPNQMLKRFQAIG